MASRVSLPTGSYWDIDEIAAGLRDARWRDAHRRNAKLGTVGHPSRCGRFHHIKLFATDKIFGGWRRVQTVHFADGDV